MQKGKKKGFANKRGKRTPSNKTPEEYLHHVRRHIESFPITESHYTRKDTDCILYKIFSDMSSLQLVSVVGLGFCCDRDTMHTFLLLKVFDQGICWQKNSLTIYVSSTITISLTI